MKKSRKLCLIGLVSVLLIFVGGCLYTYSIDKNENREGRMKVDNRGEENTKVGNEEIEDMSKKNNGEENTMIHTLGKDTNIKNDVNGDSISWMEKPVEVYVPNSGGVWYPRVIKLSNGDMLCGFDTNEDGVYQRDLEKKRVPHIL